MNLVQSITTSISSYIDMYEKTELNSTQKQAILEAREVILKSLEIIQSDEKIDAKKIKKVEKKLDEVFNNIISVFAKTNSDTPEILETKINKKLQEKEDKPMSTPKNNKKDKKDKNNKKVKVKSHPKVDLNYEEVLKIIQAVDGNVNLLKGQLSTQNMAMVAAMTIMEDLAKKVQNLEKRVKELEK